MPTTFLMYLARSLSWRGDRRQMAGVIPGDVVMHAKPVGRGYVRLRETAAHPWPKAPGAEQRAHEFHYSSLGNLPPDLPFAYEVTRGHGADGKRDGIVLGNVLASYTSHLRSVGGNEWGAALRGVCPPGARGAGEAGGGVTRRRRRW